MGAIHDLMKRLGFVKLDRYGLMLTADDRVIATRPVLDDGLGNRIVGWRDGDLAAMQLDTWGSPKPAARAALPVTLPRAPAARTRPATPLPLAPPAAAPSIAAVRPLPGLTPSKSPVIPMAPPPPQAVAPAPVLEEDDWEWEIAMARARAAAEPDPADSPTLMTPPPVMTPVVAVPALRRAIDTMPPPMGVTKEVPAEVMSRMAAVASLWPEAAHESWDGEPTPEPARPALVPRQPVRAHRADSQPATVIPVPRMPKATPSTYRPAPVVRSSQQRMPRASISEHTIQTHAAPPPANDDLTSPGIALPPAGATRPRVVAVKLPR